MRIAIVGTGISGMVAGHLLNGDHELVVYEAGSYVGGHTHTVPVQGSEGTQTVDTGFIVYNERTYPNFTRLLERLGVETQPTEMSFSVKCEETQLEYNGTTLGTLFAQRRNLFRPSFYRMLVDIFRFYRRGKRYLATDDNRLTLSEFLAQARYGALFVEQHIIPMASAIWSADPTRILDVPARFFFEFFDNHGFLEVSDRPQWRVVSGGSWRYVDRLTAGFRDRIRLSTPVRSIRRFSDRVEITDAHGATETFDAVVIATHSDQALRLLADPSTSETQILGAIKYQRNEVILHTDETILPERRRAWAAWNYHRVPGEVSRAAVTYNMNILQSIETAETYCVTLNHRHAIRPERIVAEFSYDHPVFTSAAVEAQLGRDVISGMSRTYYCGAYWGYGFHEDGVNSALAVGRHFGKDLETCTAPSTKGEFATGGMSQ